MDDAVAALGELEGWQTEEYAARIHYEGESSAYSVEFYAPTATVLYWRVEEAGEAAVPVDRTTVPTPLRDRIRADLEAAGVDPERERDYV